MWTFLKYTGGLIVISVIAVLLGTALVQASPGPGSLSLATEPERPIAGQDTKFKITILDKDGKPVQNAKPSIVAAKAARSGGHSDGMNMTSKEDHLLKQATPDKTPGEYVAVLKLDTEGEWKITVKHDANESNFTVNVLPRSTKPVAAGGSEEKGHSPQEEKAVSTSTKGKVDSATTKKSIALGDYVLSFTKDDHAKIEEETLLSVALVDAKSKLPRSGAKVEFVPVRLMDMDNDDHGDEKADGHGDMDDLNGSLPVLVAKESKSEPGVYEAHYLFDKKGQHLIIVQVEASAKQVVAFPLTVEADDDHAASPEKPNNWFLGSVGAVLAITMLMVSILKRKDRQARKAVVS